MKTHLEELLKNKNIKPTSMRILVLEILSNEKTTLSLPELEIRFENADRTTLYRTLKTFVDKKLVHQIDDGTGSLKYALCQENCVDKHEDSHVHFLCTKCNNTYCLDDIPTPEINLPQKFTSERVNLLVKGICEKCNI